MKKKNDSVLKDPRTLYTTKGFSRQKQNAPGVQEDMMPVPDSGEKSYVGHGRLTGRKALITGGDSGIGRAVAIAYAREGADVAINYLPSEGVDAESLAELLGSEGRRVALLPGDVSNEKFCQKLITNAVKELGGLDILVLNAGIQVAQDDLEKLSSKQLVRTFEVNVFPMYWLTQAAIPHLQPGSSIITTSSIQAYDPSDYLMDYAASKAAIKSLTMSFAKQLAKDGIRVNSVAPGPVWTPLEISGGQLQKNISSFGQDTLLGRAGQPAELAGVYVLLASDEASFITAQTYGVTGGERTD